MAGRPRKSLADLVRDGSFRPDRHGPLLDSSPDLPWPAFAGLQQRYRQTVYQLERHALAREFEKLVDRAHQQAGQAIRPPLDLQTELRRLGPPGSAREAIGFFPRFLSHHAGVRAGQRFELEAWQKRVLRDFLQRKNGDRVYHFLLLGVPRGNGKTPLAAGLGLLALVGQADSPEVYAVAGSKEQARIGLSFASRWREESDLAEWTQAHSWRMLCPSRGGEFRVLSSDGRLGHGLKPSRGIVDEWWLFASERERQAYVALSSALHKRPDADLIAITTAGYDRGSQLGASYEQMLKAPDVQVERNGCLTIARDPDAGALMYWYGAPDQADIDNDRILRACNPLSTLPIKDLRAQFSMPGLSELEARRLTLNQWTTVQDAWLPAGAWTQLRTDNELYEGADVYVAVDAALKYDTTAVAWAGRLDDGRIHLQARVWSARADAPHHVYIPGGRIDNELVETFITDTLARRYHVREVVYDPRYFDTQGAHLANAGLIVAEYPQGSPAMADAWQHFYQAVNAGEVSHDGDPVFAQHVAAAAAVLTERGWKVFKLRSSQPIDALVAAAMARERASRQSEADQVEYVFDLRRWCSCGHSQNRHDNGYFACQISACTCVLFQEQD